VKIARRATQRVAKPKKKSSQPAARPEPSKADSFQHLGLRHIILTARRIEPHGGTQMILLSIEDVTKKKIEK